jgi:hypothetical protein
MSCNPNQDQFIWPLEYANIVKPTDEELSIKDDQEDGVRKEWALIDYVDPEDEEESAEKVTSKSVVKPVETVTAITKIRYFISEQQANEFIASCWSVRINFQYAVDVLCGSLNRACDVKKLFQYIGLKNTQSPIKIDFVFGNDTHYDPELRRTFQPSKAQMFACDQPVILPHASRQKCTCMDCNAMCPKINTTKIETFVRENQTFIEKVKWKISSLHRVTIITIGVYILFVIAFIFSNMLLSIWNLASKRRKSKMKRIFGGSSNDFENILDKQNEKPVEAEGEKMNTNGGPHLTDEDDSETSFGGEQTGFLDRLGMKMDDTLHSIFTAYEFEGFSFNKNIDSFFQI